MAMLFFTRWYIDIWGYGSMFYIHFSWFTTIAYRWFLHISCKKGPGIGWNPRGFDGQVPFSIGPPLQSMKSSLNHHEIPLKPSWNHHETIILMGQTMTKPCLFSMLRTLPGSFGRTQLQVLGTEPGGVEKRTGPTGADVATPPGTIWLLTLW